MRDGDYWLLVSKQKAGPSKQLLGYQIDDKDITAFTAIIQIRTILAAVIYF